MHTHRHMILSQSYIRNVSHIAPTEDRHCKISGFTLRYSAMKDFVGFSSIDAKLVMFSSIALCCGKTMCAHCTIAFPCNMCDAQH